MGPFHTDVFLLCLYLARKMQKNNDSSHWQVSISWRNPSSITFNMNEAILSLLDVVPTILKLEDQTVLPVLLPVLSFRAPKAENTIPLYVMFQLFRYRDWNHPNKLFSPPKCLITLYPSVVDFVQKWPIPCVYSLVSHPNKTTTFLMEDKEYCSHWQFSRIQNVWEQMALNFATVCCRLPGLSPTWVFCPFTYVRCSRTWIKKHLVLMSIDGRSLFGSTLQAIIKDVTGGKSTHLPPQKKLKEQTPKTFLSSGKKMSPFNFSTSVHSVKTS